MGASNEEVMENLAYLKTIKLDIVEWRIDHYKDVESVEKVKELLGQIREALGDTPLLVTFRTAKEGGEKAVTVEYYAELKKVIAATGNADMIDVELFIGDDEVVKGMVDKAHECGVKVIMSNHDFHKTPEKDELVARMCKMQQLGADIPKIAVMPLSAKDVLDLLTATNEMVCEHSETPVITMAMGTLGVVSRLAGETFGSVATFGSAKVASAPGQISADELHKILNLITVRK
jgi:3-dehydroquinate dehydratase-1